MKLYKVAEDRELAEYHDGTIVHVGLAAGNNNGVDEDGVDHRLIFETRKAAGELPSRFKGIRLTAVSQHVRDGVLIKPYWRAMPEDVERIIASHESDFHMMAKSACIELLEHGLFPMMLRSPLRQFRASGWQEELTVGRSGHRADIGVWDDRHPKFPIALEIKFSHGQSKSRIDALLEDKVKVFEISIRNATLDALKDGEIVDERFYSGLIMSRKFRPVGPKDFISDFEIEYLHVEEAMRQKRQREAIMRAAAYRDAEYRPAPTQTSTVSNEEMQQWREAQQAYEDQREEMLRQRRMKQEEDALRSREAAQRVREAEQAKIEEARKLDESIADLVSAFDCATSSDERSMAAGRATSAMRQRCGASTAVKLADAAFPSVSVKEAEALGIYRGELAWIRAARLRIALPETRQIVD